MDNAIIDPIRAMQDLVGRLEHGSQSDGMGFAQVECAAFAGALHRLIAFLGHPLIGKAFEEGLQGGVVSQPDVQRVLFDSWRTHPTYRIFQSAAQENAKGLGRPLLVAWNGQIQSFAIIDPAVAGGAASVYGILGWQLVAAAQPDGSYHEAPRLTVEYMPAGAHLRSRVEP